jgi:hypothetical protein
LVSLDGAWYLRFGRRARRRGMSDGIIRALSGRLRPPRKKCYGDHDSEPIVLCIYLSIHGRSPVSIFPIPQSPSVDLDLDLDLGREAHNAEDPTASINTQPTVNESLNVQ